jgi:hypothetical protein
MAQPERNRETLAGLLPAPCLGTLSWMQVPDARRAAGLLDITPICG